MLIKLHRHRPYSQLHYWLEQQILAKCGREAGLGVFVNKNSCHNGTVPSGTMATTVEALIGPVFLDPGASLIAVKGR